jgi:Protein of unknown function (DUF1573)
MATNFRSFPRSIAVALGCMLAVASSALTARAEARPSISLDETTHDFGTVAQGSKVVHEFQIKNTGKADLVIQRVAPSCGCTATQLASPVIKPGSAEKVRVTFDTSGFIGDKTKTVLIASNDPQNPEKTVTLKGRIVSTYSVEPSRLDFGEVSPSSPLAARQREISFSVSEGADISITKISSLSPYLVASPVTTQGNKAVVKVEILPNAPKGEFRDRVVFELDGGRIASINVPVNASVKGDIRLSPDTISFGVVDGSEPLERRVQFENKGPKAVSIQSITTSDSALSANLIQVQPGRQGVLVVKVDPRRVSSDLKATVEVKTSHPTETVVSLNVFGVLPPK